MRHTVTGALFALSASAVLSLGCDSGGPPGPNSFTKVYTETIQPKCSNDFCHFNGVDIRFGGLDLSSQVRAYYSLAGQPCLASPCSERMRAVPGHPERSMFYLNLLGLEELLTLMASGELPPGTTRCGSQMPADTTYRTNLASELTFGCPDAGPECRPVTVSAEERLRIRDWIKEGAQKN